jgi:dihydrolipoamide dehydrogenase
MVVGDLSQTTQLVVIGAGPGGYVAAIRAAQMGQEVTLIEKDLLGGICLNWGCIPSKAMIEVAGLKHQLARASEMGLVTKDVSLDMTKLHAWKDGIVAKLRKGIDGLLSKNGVDVIQGKATFTEPGKISVESREGLQRFEYENAILATGSRPIELPGIPFDDEVIIDSDKALSLEKIPGRFLVVGAGSVGIEMGMVYNKLGSQVTMIEALEKLLPMIDPEISRVLEKSLSRSGVSLKLGSLVKKIIRRDSIAEVTFTEAGQEKTMEADKVLVAVGRRPNTENIGLDKLGLSTDQKGFIKVNEKMETEVKGVYAIGDIVEGPMLAHRASHMGKVAAEVIAGLPAAFDNLAIPGVIFSDPEIATVGLTEREAEEKGYKVKVGLFPFRALGRAMTLGEVEGITKIISDAEQGTVLGVHIVGPHASDLISEGALAVESGSHLEDISLTIHPHPTLPEGIAEAADAVEHKAIHIYNPPIKK